MLGVGRFELLFESGFVGSDLLVGEGKDSSAGLCEFGLARELFGREGFGTRVANTPCTKGLTTFLEVGVGVGTDLPSVVVHHVNRFVVCHNRGFWVNNSSDNIRPNGRCVLGREQRDVGATSAD